jgi:glycerol kinase
MAGNYVAAVDLGTTGVRCVIFDHLAIPVASSYREISLSYPQPGWVEQDPDEIFKATHYVIKQAISQSGVSGKDLVCFGITNQRETTIVWDRKTGNPVYPAIVWQDRRTTSACEKLRRTGLEKQVFVKTGLTLDPYFSATKIAWILDMVPGARSRAEKGGLLFGTPDTWLVWQLTGKHLTDTSNASRTLLFNIHTLSWDKQLLKAFSIPSACLPQVLPSLSKFASTKKAFFDGLGLALTAVLGDQQAALFGHCGFARYSTKMTWGTGGFLLTNLGRNTIDSKHRLLTTVFFNSTDEVNYGLEGSIFVAGAAMQWLKDGLRLIDNAQQSDAIAQHVESTEGVYFVPALTGLGCPHWDPTARGTIVGITRGTTRGHLIRAALEAIAYQTYDIVEAIESDLGHHLEQLHVDGGAARNDFLCQFQSDILDIPVIRAEGLEMTSRGAALAAGLTTDFWNDKDELANLFFPTRKFQPRMEKSKREQLLDYWGQAVQRSKGWQR